MRQPTNYQLRQRQHFFSTYLGLLSAGSCPCSSEIPSPLHRLKRPHLHPLDTFTQPPPPTHSTPSPLFQVAAALRPDYVGVEVGPGLELQLQHGPHTGRLLFAGHKDKYSKRGTTLWLSDDGGGTWTLQHHFPFMNEDQMAEVNRDHRHSFS